MTFILFYRRFDGKVVLSIIDEELAGIGYLDTIKEILAFST